MISVYSLYTEYFSLYTGRCYSVQIGSWQLTGDELDSLNSYINLSCN